MERPKVKVSGRKIPSTIFFASFSDFHSQKDRKEKKTMKPVFFAREREKKTGTEEG